MVTFAESNPAAWAAGRARARAERDAGLPGMRATVAELEAQVARNDPALYTTDNGRTSSKAVDLEVLRYGIHQIEQAQAHEGTNPGDTHP